MTIELRPARAEDAAELGRICYEAFKDISDRHGFPTDFISAEFAQRVIAGQVQDEQVYGVAAFEDGAPKGSNFVNLRSDVAGIGPVSVDLSSQGQGIGRKLMEDAIAHARAQGYEMIRLCQDSFNMQSLALYASLGFDTKEPIALLELASDLPVDPAIRPATSDDFEAMDELCRSIYRVSRMGGTVGLIEHGFPAFVLDRGHVAGYLVGTLAGHGVAESDDDMLALLAGLGARAPEAQAFVAIRHGELYRRALAAGHRNRKLMNLMALGPYEEPRGTYCPSVIF